MTGFRFSDIFMDQASFRPLRQDRRTTTGTEADCKTVLSKQLNPRHTQLHLCGQNSSGPGWSALLSQPVAEKTYRFQELYIEANEEP